MSPAREAALWAQLLAMVKAGHVDLERLRMGTESFGLDPIDGDHADARRDGEDWWDPKSTGEGF